MRRCTHCNFKLEGRLIYLTFLEEYGNHKQALEAAKKYGATKTRGRWQRDIGKYDIDKDRCVYFTCPNCNEVTRTE